MLRQDSYKSCCIAMAVIQGFSDLATLPTMLYRLV